MEPETWAAYIWFLQYHCDKINTTYKVRRYFKKEKGDDSYVDYCRISDAADYRSIAADR